VLVCLTCITQLVRKQLGHTNTNQRDAFPKQLGGKSVLNS
jgi:hypothetical protein